MNKDVNVKTCAVFGNELPVDAVRLATTTSPHPLNYNQLVEWDMYQGKDDIVYARPGCIKCKCCGQILKRSCEITKEDFVGEDSSGTIFEVVWRISLTAS